MMLIFTSIISNMDITLFTNAHVQVGSMTSLQNTSATHAISIILGEDQKESPHHFYQPAINGPIRTTVAWLNNDFGQPHTGSVFNSGIMPTTSNSFFQYTLDQSGNYVYHCLIHLWRVAIVTVSDDYERGHYIQMSSGVESELNLTDDYRILLNFEPLTVKLGKATPLTYNITYNITIQNKFKIELTSQECLLHR